MAAHERSMLGNIALGVGGAAVVGFGAAAGRDLWKSTKNTSGFLLLLAVLAAAAYLPFRGVRNIVRGNEDGSGVSAIDVLSVMAGPVIVIGILLPSGMADGSRGIDVYLEWLLVPLFGGLYGLAAGLSQRKDIQQRIEVSDANERFLEKEGFRETGEREITHYDGDDNALRVMERTDSSIVFMAVGRRNQRAYIRLDQTGRMLDYTGVVALGSKRTA